jgi:hypothetical protein
MNSLPMDTTPGAAGNSQACPTALMSSVLRQLFDRLTSAPAESSLVPVPPWEHSHFQHSVFVKHSWYVRSLFRTVGQ